jgi:tetratricopeptide (TPR) repeat protein
MPILFHLLPPKSWEDFESMLCDLFKEVWKDSHTQKHGRLGQPQSGVDVFGQPGEKESWSGVQAKKKDLLIGSSVTEAELIKEVDKAKTFEPRLSEFIIATTGPRDQIIQKKARLITADHQAKGLFRVHVYSWEDIEELLDTHPDVRRRWYPELFPDDKTLEVATRIETRQREYFHAQQGPSGGTQIVPVKDLRFKSFKLGDDAAASFPYVVEPVKEVYNQSIQILQEALDPTRRVKAGVLFLGESNAGKTRLALESIKQVLSGWLLLRWQPYYTINHIPPIQTIKDKSLVLLLDDLQEYLSVQIPEIKTISPKDNLYLNMTSQLENPSIIALRELLETLLQVTPNIVIVATCRTEYLEKLNAELGEHLLIRLRKLYLPSFNSNSENFQAKQVITAFQKKGNIYLEDWDGTIGSLILGLSRKYEQYIVLPRHVQAILKTIKLMAYAAIFKYPEQYIRRICIAIFPDGDILHEEVFWQASVEQLLQKQFLMEAYDKTDERLALTIRSDLYLEKVISDYPPQGRSIHRVEQDISRLLEILLDIGDTVASSNVALSFLVNEYPEKAIEAYNRINVLDEENTSNYNNKGIALIRLGNIEEALQACQRAIEVDETNIPARVNEEYCFRSLDRYDEALRSCEQLLSFDPMDAYFWEQKGACLTDLGQFNRALEVLDYALSLEIKNVNKWYNISLDLPANIWSYKFTCFFALKMFDEALEAFDRSYALNKNNSISWDIRGYCFEQRGKYSEAIKSYEHSLMLKPGVASTWFRKGICLRLLESYEEALKAFDQVIALEPKSINGWYNKGLCFELLGQNKEASITFECAISSSVEDEDSWYDKAHCFEKLGRYREAINIYEQCLVAGSNKSSDWDAIGINLTWLNRPIDALQAFEKALAYDSSNSEIWRHKGKCLLDDLDRYEEALDAFEHAFNLDAANTSALIGKGICLARLGRAEESLKVYDQILISDSTNIYAINNKGNCLLELGRPEEALSFFEQALATSANAFTHENKSIYAAAWYSKGICLSILEKYEKALNAFEKSIELGYYGASVWTNKAKCLHLLGRNTEASEALQMAPLYSSVINNKDIKIYQKNSYHSNDAASDKVISNRKKKKRKLQQKSRKANREKH